MDIAMPQLNGIEATRRLAVETPDVEVIALSMNADRRCIAVTTVETHRRQLAEKLNLRTIAELTKYAIREGLTSGDS